MEGDHKRIKGDTFRVVVQLVGEDSCHQYFREGHLTMSEIDLLRKFFGSGPNRRIKTVKDDPESPESRVLQSLYRYDPQEEWYEESLSLGEYRAFKDISDEHVMDSPCYFVCLFGTD